MQTCISSSNSLESTEIHKQSRLVNKYTNSGSGLIHIDMTIYIIIPHVNFKQSDWSKGRVQSLTKVAILTVIRSGFYEDRQKLTLWRSECPTQFFSNILSKYFLLPSQACLECL